jgi:hypothetical protein
MRAFLLATVLAAGLGLAGTAPTLAAPINGAAITQAVDTARLIEPVRYWHYHYRWRWHRHYYHRRWW